MWMVSREGKKERTVGPNGIFPTFLLILSLVSLINVLLPTPHLHFQSLFSFLKLKEERAEVVIHKNLIKARRRQMFCHLSLLSTLLVFMVREKEHEHFLPTASISSLHLAL